MASREELELAIAAQEQLRGAVADSIIDATIAALRDQLAIVGAPDNRRCQVTVLFADVSGFTALSEEQDAEVVNDIMNAIWARLDAVITAHGGNVDKHIGDAVMAVWGSDRAREDDPEQAVRAALELQSALALFRSDSGYDLTMRVGVNTGPALVGRVGTVGESSVIGDAVNVANRLQHAAPLDGVLISHFTYRHVRGVFDVDASEPIRVKGKSDPLRVYRVLRAKQRAFRLPSRGVEGVETRMVGRERELSVVRDAFKAVSAGLPARYYTIVGEAGIGKSRLLYELEDWIDLQPEGAYFFKGRALATRQAVPFGLFRDLIAARLGVLESDTPAQVATKLAEGMSAVLTGAQTDVVGHWLGFDLGPSDAVKRLSGSDQYPTVARSHLARYIEALAGEDAVVIFLEDLHWADDESLDLVAFLAERLRETRVLMISAARPSLLERRPEWWSEARAEAVELLPLSEHATRALVEEVLQQSDEVPVRLTDLITERADGNAFFVEEILKMLIDDDVIHVEPDRWQVELDRLDPARVPPTLTGVLQARLDALDPAERDVLQRASIIGRIFWDGAIASMSGAGETATPPDTIGELAVACARELVYRRETSSFERCTEYIFKHALLRDVTYETVLLRDRGLYHRRAAAWIEANCGERRAEYLEMLADHYERGGELTTAADRLAESAARARLKGNNLAVRRSLERAVRLWQESSQSPPVEPLAVLAEAYWRLGDLQAADDVVERVILESSEPHAVAHALNTACAVAQLRGDSDRERELIDRALAIAEPLGGVALARTLVALAWFAALQGDHETAAAAGKRSLELAEHEDADVEIGRALGAIGFNATLVDDLETAELMARRSLELSLRSGNSEVEALDRGHLGMIAHLRGDASCPTSAEPHYRAAVTNYLDALTGVRALGSRVGEGWQLLNLAQVSVRLGDDDAARAYLRDAAHVVADISASELRMFCFVVEADRCAALGDVDRALALLGMASTNPACNESVRQEIDRVLTRIDRTPEAIEAGMARDLSLDADAVIAQIGQLVQ